MIISQRSIHCNVDALFWIEAFPHSNLLRTSQHLLLFTDCVLQKPYFVLAIIITDHQVPWSWLCSDLDLLYWRHFPTHWQSSLKQILSTWAESEQMIIPLYFLTAHRHFSLSFEAQRRGGQLADICDSTQGMLSLDLDAFSGSEPSTLLWHEACLGVKAQPGVLRVLHSSSVSLSFFLFTLCWKSAEQTQTYKAKGWLCYLINLISEGLFAAKL